jgi:signal transduction histidine kinase
MKKLFSLLSDKYLNEDIDFRAQIFNLFAMTGLILGIIIAISCVATNAGIINIAVNLLASALAFVLLEYANRTGYYKRCYLITVIVVFIIAFPILFFTAGGYHSGMPSFFVFAIVFTVFMLQGKSLYVMIFMEFIVYMSICLIAYHYPETVSFFESERDVVMDIVIGFTATSAALGITIFRHTGIYDIKQRQLARANDALKQIDRMKTEFLGNISHELKTPLTVVSGYAQDAERQLYAPQMDNAAVAAQMKLIYSEAERLAMMVSRILDVTHIDEGGMSIYPTKVSMIEIIQRSVETYYHILNRNNNRLSLKLPDGLPPVRVDAERISQVLVNLLSNAIHHTQSGMIIITAAEKSGHVEVTVADNGEGIPAQQIPLLFKRYKSGRGIKKFRSDSKNSTGLGLFICKHIIESHGGSITVESVFGEGTTIRFTLPIHN